MFENDEALYTEYNHVLLHTKEICAFPDTESVLADWVVYVT
jgi:hypothetical protein